MGYRLLSRSDDTRLSSSSFGVEIISSKTVIRYCGQAWSMDPDQIEDLRLVLDVIRAYRGQGGDLKPPTTAQIDKWSKQANDERILDDYGMADLKDLERAVELLRMESSPCPSE